MRMLASMAVAAALSCTGMALGQASFTPSGYAENFDSMGATGTAAPLGWKHFVATFGTNGTWAASIPASGANSVATMAATTAGTVLAATTTPAANNTNGFNAARAAAATSDRVLATAPTGIAGAFLQLQLTNDSGVALPAGSPLTVSFDIIRYTAVGTANELPGYWLFISADGGATWTNAGPNPTIASVPNTAGITNSSITATLPGAWNSGASLYFRWIDDNAVQTSPDQIIGLNNVVISSSATPVTGRCCFADGSCTETDSVSCAGIFTAAGVCTPNTCPLPPTGSCCQSDGACTVTLQAACSFTWTTAGTCTPNTCPVLIASLAPAGYLENFDALGPTGTALPTGYSMWTVVGDRPTFEEIANGGLGFITPSAVSTATTVTGALAVYDQTGTATPGTRNAGYNFGFSAATANRLLGVSPTGNGASFMQLRLRNDTGAAVTNLTVQYTFRIMSPWTANELAGFEFFYSTSGPTGTYTAIPSLDSVATSSDLTGDSIAKSGVINLASPLAPGAELLIRLGDDNGNASPDQAYAIDNVSILGVDPSTLGACCAGNGFCSLVLNDDVCIGGIFRGVGTTCATANCPQPPSGSCCATNGSCSITIQANCSTLWTLDGNCTPNICPGPLSACCAADGTCALLPAGQCAGFVVDGTCTPFLCRQPGMTRCIAFGDYGIDGGNQPAVASRMKTFNPEFLLTTGDNTYNTSSAISNYDNTQAKYYREFIKITNPASAYFGQGAPVNNFYPLMGNHDMDIGGGASTSIPYWNAYWELPGNERYYTFSRGPIDFFMLSSDGREPDSNSATGAQHAWFAAAYAASTAQYKIVAFHHPAQTSVSGHGPDNTMRSWNFQNLPGITAVLSGHNHNMERLEFGGIPWFVTGAGGNSLYTISSVDPSSVFRNDTQWGFLMIDADNAGITFRFVNAAGQVLDTRSIVALPMLPR